MSFSSFKDKELIEAINSLRFSVSDRLKSLNRDDSQVSVSTEIDHTRHGTWTIEVQLIKSAESLSPDLLLMLNLNINKSTTKERLFKGDDIKEILNYLQRLTTTEEWIRKISQSAYIMFEYSGSSRPPR